MSGFNYVGRDGENIIWLWSQDIQAEATKALALTETATLTFARKTAPETPSTPK